MSEDYCADSDICGGDSITLCTTHSPFLAGIVAAGAGGKSRSKFGTTSALLSMSRQTPSIAPTTVAVAKACVESNFGRPTPST